MSVLRKSALAMVVPAAGALLMTGAGPAQAAGDLYGAIAISFERSTGGGDFPSHNTGAGVAVNYPSQDAADEAARNACRAERCVVMARIHNECGSISEYDTWAVWTNAVQPVYTTGKGPTAAAAEKDAMDMGHAGIAFPTTAALFAVGAARIVKPLFILDTICTSNVG